MTTTHNQMPIPANAVGAQADENRSSAPRQPRTKDLAAKTTTEGRHRCGRCPATWSGANVCHCTGCHETFNSVGAFDRHRRGGECLDPATIGYVLDSYGKWVKPLPEGAFR